MSNADRDRELRVVGDPDPDLVPLRSFGAARDPGERLLAGALGRLYPDLPPPPADPKLWLSIEAEAETLARKRRRAHALREQLLGIGRGRLLAYAALAAALLLVPWLLPRAPELVREAPAPAPISAARAELSSGPAGGEGSARLFSGARLHISRGSAEIDQAEPARARIALRSGLLGVAVPKLAPGGSLRVVTADAEVIVHGTRFAVSKLQANATEVRVHEGLVEVQPIGGGRQPVFLRGGEKLTVPSAGRYLAQLAGQLNELLSRGACAERDLQDVDAFLDGAAAGTDVSAALYLKGYCAVQRGRTAEAIASFERAGASAADPVRADNALARAAQLLAQQGRAQGTLGWRRYLERFPDGLHRESARRYLGKGPER